MNLSRYEAPADLANLARNHKISDVPFSYRQRKGCSNKTYPLFDTAISIFVHYGGDYSTLAASSVMSSLCLYPDTKVAICWFPSAVQSASAGPAFGPPEGPVAEP